MSDSDWVKKAIALGSVRKKETTNVDDIRCKYSDGVKWYKIEIRVDGKAFPCCHYLEKPKEFERENLGSSAEDFERTILPNYRKLCYRKCNILRDE